MPAAIRSRPFTASWLTRQHTPSASSCRARCAARAQSGAFCGCSAAHSAHSRSTVHSPYRPKSCRRWISPGCAEAFSSDTPSPAVSRTNTAVSSMQALEQRSRLSTRRVSVSPRAPSSAAQRTGRFSSPAGQASTTGFAASSAAGVSSGSTTASTAGSRYAPGCGAVSSFASSS